MKRFSLDKFDLIPVSFVVAAILFAGIVILQITSKRISYKESAEYIYEHVSSNEKTLTAYPNSSHLMTRSEDKDEIEENIIAFLK